MQRTLEQIENDLKERFISEEYLPKFIERNEDLEVIANSFAEFIAPYVKQSEDLEYIWDNENLLKTFLLSRNMFLSGDEDLNGLRTIAQNRYKIIMKRGTILMLEEIQRLCNEDEDTELILKDRDQCGWYINRTSPLYRESDEDINISFINAKEFLIFKLKNNTLNLSNNEIKEIIKKYFQPKHIRTIINFL